VNNRAERPEATNSTRHSTTKDATFSGAQDAVAHTCYFDSTNKVVFQRIGDKNILPFAHVFLAFLQSLTFIPDALLHIEGQIPWKSIVTFLSTLEKIWSCSVSRREFCHPTPME
jgi:hypothetical protein